MAVSATSRDKRVMEKIRSVVLGAGYLEGMTFSFTDAQSVARVRPWSTSEPITLLHSSRKHENKLRQSLIPSLLDALRLNEARGNEGVKLFECAPVYLPSEKNLLPTEPMVIGMVTTGDIRLLRGVVETVLSRVGLSAMFRPADRVGFETGEAGEYLVDGVPIAVVGVVSNQARGAIDLRASAVAAEILLPPLIEKRFCRLPSRHCRTVPRWCETWRSCLMNWCRGRSWNMRCERMRARFWSRWSSSTFFEASKSRLGRSRSPSA